jgi:hypothetical protein
MAVLHSALPVGATLKLRPEDPRAEGVAITTPSGAVIPITRRGGAVTVTLTEPGVWSWEWSPTDTGVATVVAGEPAEAPVPVGRVEAG